MPVQPEVPISIAQLALLFQEVGLPNALEQALANTHRRFYQRLFPPLVVVWLWIFQRLNPDHTCDTAVSYAKSGALDGLADRHVQPLSQRVGSESSSAYCQARQRLAFAVWPALLQHTAQTCRQRLGDAAHWHGHPVGLLDGTTLLLRPHPALVAAFGQASNGHTTGYWAILRLVAGFCLVSGALLGVATGPYVSSEQALAEALFATAVPDSLYVGDANFGVFSVVQAATRCGLWVLMRLNAGRARALLKRQAHVLYGADVPVCWQPSAQERKQHPAMAATPIPGRLLQVCSARPGFRPVQLYLFTTLLDAQRDPLEDLVELYGQRWQVELDLRYVKSALDLELLDGYSVDIVCQDLYAGLVGYNLIRWQMLQAAQLAGQPGLSLSFTRCWRRIRLWFGAASSLPQLWQSLADCLLPQRPRFRIEPRKVRPARRGYPFLRGSRTVAREQALAKLREPPKS